jgi:hypothetical protein
MMGIEIHEVLSASAKGLRCTKVDQYAPDSWSFDFEGQLGLNVQCPWRITNDHGIALGSTDHGQMFGLSAAVDGSTRAVELFSASVLKQIVIAEKTADITLEFESGIRLEVFNNSSGYEGWNCGTPLGLRVIGMGGGSTGNVAASS